MAGSLKKVGIGADDCTFESDESYPLSTWSRQGSLGTITGLTKMPNLLMTHQDKINARYYNSGALTDVTIQAAITAIGSSDDRVIYLEAGTWVISTAITATSNIYFEFSPGAVLQPAAGITFTIYSPEHIIASPRQQIVDITNNSTDPIAWTQKGTVYPEWWGAKGDGSTDDTDEIQCMFDSMPREGRFIMSGNYVTSAAITFAAYFYAGIIDGAGSGSIIGDFNGPLLNFSASFGYSTIRNFYKLEQENEASGSYVLYVPDGELWIGATIEKCQIAGSHTGFYGRGNVITFRDVTWGNLGYSGGTYKVHLYKFCANVEFYNCVFAGTVTHAVTMTSTTGGGSTVSFNNCHWEVIADSIIFVGQSAEVTFNDCYLAYSPVLDLNLGSVTFNGGVLNHSNIFVETASRTNDPTQGIIYLNNVIMRDSSGGDGAYVVNDGSFFIVDVNDTVEVGFKNYQFTPTLSATEILSETDFATQNDWDIAGDVSKGASGLTFAWDSGSLNGTAQQTNGDMANAPSDKTEYLFEYYIDMITEPDGNFVLSLDAGDGELPFTTKNVADLPITHGRHAISFLSDDSASTGNFTIRATETTSEEGEFIITDVSLKQITDIDGWLQGNSELTAGGLNWYWPYLISPNGVIGGSLTKGDSYIALMPDDSGADTLAAEFYLYQYVNFKPNVTYRLDVTVYNAANEYAGMRVRYWDRDTGTFPVIKDFYVGQTTSAMDPERVSVYFILSAAEAANNGTVIFLKNDTGDAYFYEPRLYECGDFQYAARNETRQRNYFEV